nr:MAG TPA: hypothetical protein [Caudoviricetes sp.]
MLVKPGLCRSGRASRMGLRHSPLHAAPRGERRSTRSR